MRKLLLHIGMHKTGSSSIQESLSGYRDDTSLYARFAQTNHSVPMTAIFSEDRYNYHIFRKNGHGAERVDALRATALDCLERDLGADAERLIVSGEDISILPDAGKSALLEYFEDRGLEVEVICFLRDPVSLATSQIQQWIKGGMARLPPSDPRYVSRLERFRAHLGAENMIVRDFASVVAQHGDAVTGFCALTGLRDVAASRVNESLSATATKLFFRLNKALAGNPEGGRHMKARRQLRELLFDLYPGGGGDRLDSGAVAGAITPECRNQLGYVERHFGIALEPPRAAFDLDAVDAYLTDLDGADLDPLGAALERLGIAAPFTADDMMLALFGSFLSAQAPDAGRAGVGPSAVTRHPARG